MTIPNMGAPQQRNRGSMPLKATDIDHVRQVLSGEVTLKELASDTARRKVVAAITILYGNDCAAELADRRSTFSELLYEITVRPGLEEADKPCKHEHVNLFRVHDLVPISRKNGLHASRDRSGTGLYLPQQPLFDALFQEDERFRVAAHEFFAAAMTTINDRRAYAAGVGPRTKRLRAALASTYANTSLGYYGQTENWKKIDARHVKEARDVLDEILRLNFPELLED